MPGEPQTARRRPSTAGHDAKCGCRIWADAIALAGVIATVVVGRQTLRKKRLTFTIASRSRLMNAPQVIRDDLKISYKKQALTDPYVIVLELASMGDSAIPSASFDGGRSLKIGLSAGIKTILWVEHEPSSSTKPEIAVREDRIELEPKLIAKDEIIKISLLTEGPSILQP